MPSCLSGSFEALIFQDFKMPKRGGKRSLLQPTLLSGARGRWAWLGAEIGASGNLVPAVANAGSILRERGAFVLFGFGASWHAPARL